MKSPFLSLLAVGAALLFGACASPPSIKYASIEAALAALPELREAKTAYFSGVAQSARDLAYTSDDVRSIAEVVRTRNQQKRDRFLAIIQIEKVMDPDMRQGYLEGFRSGEVSQIMSFILEVRKRQK
jgi:hypothetical protein